MAAPHLQPPCAAEGARPRAGGHTIKVPLRLVVGAQYPDAALSTYVKIAALALRPEGCTAKVAVIAGYLGMSKSSVERGLRPLIGPDLVDGITEIPTVRRTLPGGTGESAHRVTRILTTGELWVRIPIRAAEALSPRLLRLYALLAYATARRIPVTAAELAEQLYHHTGDKAGRHLSERQARRLVDELEATGWLTVHRREGEQGRHAYETHRHPLHSVPATITTAATEPAGDEQLALWDTESPVIHDGSGPGDHDGSLATEEDLSTDRPGETEKAGGIRRRRTHVSTPRGASGTSVPDTFAPDDRVLRTDSHTPPSSVADRAPYTGPGLQLSPRVWRVLTPLHHELPGISTFVLRKIARAIGAHLNDGTDEQRLTDRLERRYATTTTVRDIGRWILGAALVRHGCGRPDCETGVIWPTGADCELCAANRQTTAARAQREADLAASELRLVEQRRQRETQTGGAAEGQEQHGLAASTAGEQLLAQPGADPSPSPAGDVPLQPAVPWPARATEAERTAATPADIRTAIARHGPAAAVHVYGLRLVAPHLNALDLPDTGT
ncbi:hypothetical protein ACW4TU_18635 [Streptomyces sp. QTS52]